MNALNYTTARKELAQTMETVCRDNAPVIITKNRDCAVVMISLADYSAYAVCKFFNKKSVQIVEANSHISG